jgi:hypothetical protein
MTPDPNQSMEVFADADFCGLYNQKTAIFDPTTAKSCTVFFVMYTGCPIIWASKLQTKTALSTTLRLRTTPAHSKALPVCVNKTASYIDILHTVHMFFSY